MTQLEHAKDILKSGSEKLGPLNRELAQLLAAAQNPPPHGESDGSINEATFNQLRTVERTLRGALEAVERAKYHLNRGPTQQ